MKIYNFLSILVIALFFMGCKKSIPADLSDVSFIPHPLSVEATGTAFEIKPKLLIEYNSDQNSIDQADLLSKQIFEISGFEPVVQDVSNGNSISLEIDQALSANDSYEISIEENQIAIKANNEAGLFYAVHTLLQAIEYSADFDAWIIPSGLIKDAPKFEYRGAMLDVARHFFSVNDVKRFIDLIAAYKLNVLHLHLSDDQGWRIEIKSWPKLSEIGGSTAVDGDMGGYYSQEDYKEIVAYASSKFITIIPEIDMPGHTNAALASYPELNCNGKAPELYTGTKVGFSTLCTDKEITYQFVDDVIRELAEITPGPYIHIGGDESHVTAKDDYISFINRTNEIVKSHNKTMMGWDEIALADIDSNDVVQYWAKDENATLAVEKGAKVVLSPSKRVYLDMQYDSTTHLGLHWAAYIEVDSAYIWSPKSLVDGVNKDDILGIESPLWTETITNMEEIEYMVFPRILGHAEIAWSDEKYLDWDLYKHRLAKHAKQLKRKEINYYPSKLVPWK